MIIPRSITLLLGGLLLAVDQTSILTFALTAQQIGQDLQSQLSSGSEIVATSQATYDADFTPRYSISAPPSYVVGVRAALVDDVQKTVSCFKLFPSAARTPGPSMRSPLSHTPGEICTAKQRLHPGHRRRPRLLDVVGPVAGRHRSGSRHVRWHPSRSGSSHD